MSEEFVYIDEDGNKTDVGLHEELLREDDPIFQLEQTAMLLRDLRESGQSEVFEIMKKQYIAGIKEHDIESEVDLTPF